MLSLTVFVVVSGEMMPTAVLPQMADGLEVSMARAGLLVTAWAAMVVLASFPLTRLTSKIERPRVIAGALTVFGVATLATAAAQSYSVAMGSRLVAAAATALLWSTVNAHAASVVPRERIARATAVVLFGGTLGTVGAIPAGNAVADLVGWRAPFAVLGGLALVTAVPVLVLLRRPSITMQNDEAASDSASRAGLMPVVSIATLGGLVLVAHFIPFTFVVELLEPSQIPTPALLLVIGVVGAAGVVLVGATSDRYPGAVPAVMALGMAVSVASLAGIGRHGGLDLAVILVWGVVIGAVGPAVQAGLMRVAGPEHRGTAGALMPVAMNLGIAVGAAVGSGVVDRWSPAVLPLLAVVPALIALAGFVVVARGTLQRTGGHVSHLDMRMSDTP
jgi:predicted MFS family arabinose efflux permease